MEGDGNERKSGNHCLKEQGSGMKAMEIGERAEIVALRNDIVERKQWK